MSRATKLTALTVSGNQTIGGSLTVTGSISSVSAGVQSGVSSTLTARVTVTNAQIKGLRAAPKTLVAGVAGYVLEFVGATLLLDYGSNVLTESAANMAVRYTDGSGAIVSQAIEATNFIDAAADTATSALPKIDAIAAKTGCEGQALVLHNTGAGEYGGNAASDTVIRVLITYRLHLTGW